MGSTMCEVKYYAEADKGEYTCKKCGRTAAMEKKLCKPRKTKDESR